MYRRRADPRTELRALIYTVLIAISVVLAGFWVLADDDGSASPAGATSRVDGLAEGGRVLVSLDRLELGSVQHVGNEERIRWASLVPAGAVDLAPGPAALAESRLTFAPLTEVRVQFATAKVVLNGALLELKIPQNTLRLSVPGEPGRPGDTLVLVFDVAESVANDASGFRFTPYVSAAYWVRGEADPERSWSLDEGLLPGADEDGDGNGDEAAAEAGLGNGPGGGGGGGGNGVPPTQHRSKEPVGPPGGGSGGSGGAGGGDGGGDGGDDDGAPSGPDPAIMNVYVRDAAGDSVESLVVPVRRIAVQAPDGSLYGIYEGDRAPDLAQLRGARQWELLAQVQFSEARDVAGLHIEFAATGSAVVNGLAQQVVVPQPILVLEPTFLVPNGTTFDVLIDFSIPESLTPGAEGWEFRPVAQQYQLSSYDVDLDGVADPMDPDDDNDGTPDNQDLDRDDNKVPDNKPAQYRAGGPSLPTVGHSNNKLIVDATGGKFNLTETQKEGEERLTGGQGRPLGSDDSVSTDPQPPRLSAPTSAPHNAVPSPARGQGEDAAKRVQVILTLLNQNIRPVERQLEDLQAEVVAELYGTGVPVLLVNTTEDRVRSLQALPGVVSVILNERLEELLDVARVVTMSASVTSSSSTWHAADGSVLDGRGVGVAVVDSGIDGTHPDLEYGVVVKRNLKVLYSGYKETVDTDTSSGHGTHVAGVVAGRGAVRAEYRGIAPGATLYGLGAGEGTTVFWSLQGFDWILQNHATVDPPIRVVVNAWGGLSDHHDPLSPVSMYVDRMVDRGIVVVFAAGNDGGDGTRSTTSGESSDPREGVLSVGGYDDRGRETRDGRLADYSSRGAKALPSTWPDLVAPATKVTAPLALTGAVAAEGALYESTSTAYATLSGTSMAAPAVAGAAAILLQYDPSLTPAQVEAALERSAYKFDGTARDHVSSDLRYKGSTFDRGHGLLDIQAALALVAMGGV